MTMFFTRSITEAQSLIDNGADVNARDEYGSTPLHLVSTIEIAKLLIKNGADINATDNHGYIPLHTILSVEVGQLLIDNGADVNAISRYGRTPLHITRNVKVTKLLIKNGADVNMRDDLGQTPLLHIKDRDEKRIMDIAYYIKNYQIQLEILKEKQNNIVLQNELTNILLPFIKEKHLIPDILSMKFQMEFEEATQ